MAAGLAGALLLSPALPGTAWAASGDAGALGVVVALNSGALGALLNADAVVGTATAPAGIGRAPTDQDSLATALAGAVGVTGTGTVVAVDATGGPTSSIASVQVADVTLDVFGVPVLAIGGATAAVTCRQTDALTGARTAGTTLAGLRLFGEAVPLDAATPAVTATREVVVAGLSSARLTVTLTRVESTTARIATATAVRAGLSLTAAGRPFPVVLGTVTIAGATCERPAAVPATPAPTTPAPSSETPDATPITTTGPPSGAVTPRATATTPTTAPETPAATAPTTRAATPEDTAATPTTGPATRATVAVAPEDAATPPATGAGLVPGAAPGGPGNGDDPDGPTVSALSPDRGPTSGGQTVVITGSGFHDTVTTVAFDGVRTATAAVVDEDTLVLRTPPGVPGAAEVVVTVDGVASEPLTYAYVTGATLPTAPTAGALDPGRGSAAGGTRVTVTGSAFVPGQTSVIVCDTTLLPDGISVAAGGRSLTVVTPACAPGERDVVVVTPGGVSAALPFTYAEGAAPDGAGAGPGGGGGAGPDSGGPGSDGGGGAGQDSDDGPGVAGSGDLAETGSEVARVSALGLLLVLAGAGLTGAARRRPVRPS